MSTTSVALRTVVLILLGCGVLCLAASAQEPPRRPREPFPAPTIDTPSATLTTVATNTPTTVLVTARIAHPAHIASALNLIRLNSSGAPTMLGQLHDDGKNGDAVAGDGIFTIQVLLNEAVPGPIQVQVSGAFRGMIRRVLSPPLTLMVADSQPR
jgi:hypothetical protein